LRHALRRRPGESNAELAALPAYRVGHDAVDADGGERAGEDAKQRRQRRHQPRLAHRFADHMVHRLDLADREHGIDRRDDLRAVGTMVIDRRCA
jgi:hypothetical protein